MNTPHRPRTSTCLQLQAGLFPWLIGDFALRYAQLGLLVSVFFVVSAVGHAFAGFVVERVGARPVLVGALVLFVAGSPVL